MGSLLLEIVNWPGSNTELEGVLDENDETGFMETLDGLILLKLAPTEWAENSGFGSWDRVRGLLFQWHFREELTGLADLGDVVTSVKTSPLPSIWLDLVNWIGRGEPCQTLIGRSFLLRVHSTVSVGKAEIGGGGAGDGIGNGIILNN